MVLRLVIAALAAVAVVGCGADEEDAVVPRMDTAASETTVTTVEDGATTTETVVEQAPIVVESPSEGDTVTSPLRIRGSASVFEATLVVRILGSGDETLAEVPLTAREGAPNRGDFDGTIAFEVDEPQDATIEVFSPSAADGTEQHKVRVPVRLEPGD